MGVQVAFNYAAWASRYPEFAYIPAAAAQDYFNEATLYHANDGSGPVSDPGQQSTLLNMITAHIAKMNAPLSTGAPAPDTVGRINSAGEGSVSVGLDMSYPPGDVQWYLQTKYGAAYWAATRIYRTMQYHAGTRYNPNPYLYGFGRRLW
jgi:Protein of unknown function (DUF4054)